jgi:hypothetical protein
LSGDEIVPGVDEAMQQLSGADYECKITITAQVRGAQRRIGTVAGGPGFWSPSLDDVADDMVQRVEKLEPNRWGVDHWLRRIADDIDSYVRGELPSSMTGQGRRASEIGEIPWAVVSFVCDVVFKEGRRSFDFAALEAVAKQHSSKILALAALPQERREHAECVLSNAIVSVVVLPLKS